MTNNGFQPTAPKKFCREGGKENASHFNQNHHPQKPKTKNQKPIKQLNN
jgi:hypothetical protein